MIVLALLACGPDATAPATGQLAFGLPLVNDGQLYAGVARVDITPSITETFDDLDGDYYFDGCPTDPTASRSSCLEPFDDANGNGRFDAVWMGGWGGGGRAARGVHDAIYATALVLALDGEYLALVSLDAVGLLEYRTTRMRQRLDEAGFAADRVVVANTHTHQGPDTVGLWGNLDELITGLDPEYQASLEDAVHDAVYAAATTAVPVAPTQGAVNLVNLDPAYSGAPFGGTNPDDRMLGLVRDGRDPILVDDQVLTLALDGANGRLATVVSYSAHPEVVGYENDLIGADYVGVTRALIEDDAGGTAMFLPSAVGGMQSAHGGTLPAVDEAGAPVYDDAGERVFITGDGYEYARVAGTLVAQAALAAPVDDTPWDTLSVRSTAVMLPLTNLGFQVALRTDVLDQPWDSLVTSNECPGMGTDPEVIACVSTGVWHLQLGPISLGTVPGELLPELFYGVPAEPGMESAAARSTDPRFPHHPAACDDADWSTCREQETDGDCACEDMHAAPYVLSYDEAMPALADTLPGPYRAVIGLANGYIGYAIPEPDYSSIANAITGIEGNHSEEWYSGGSRMAPAIQDGWLALEP
ncbi:MAG: neutral/alkaline non-lysosomal ceramidase N-terminal domain-containing protein [Deltaproteobacteria bacterium]|nr:neutral/alkaline non-lysosomal ceramidase N-terminal domain-containing protein [Deltaproteobacteria bacterium]